MFTLQTNKGPAQGDICDLLASVDGGALVALPAMRAEWRPGVVTGLAIMHRVLSLYHDAPHPWPAATWRAVWDLQLGPELRRAVAPLNEPALFQPTVEDGKGKIRPYAVEALTVFPAKEHAIKSSASATPEEWLLGILGGQFRAFANFNVATGRSLALLAVPTDGTLGSEIRSLSSAFSAKPGTSAKEHLPWLRPKPAAPVPVSDLPQPVLELERTIRLLEDGTAVYQSSNARWLAGDITDPSMVWDRTAGKRWAPRPDTPRYRMLHVVLAGSEDKERPPLVGRLDGNPALRVMCLHMGQDKATGASGGYWETRLRVPKEAGTALRLAGLGAGDRPGVLSKRMVEAVGTAIHSVLKPALYRALGEKPRQQLVTAPAIAAAEAEIGMETVRLFLDLLPRPEDPVAEQTAIGELLRAHVESWFSRVARGAEPLRRADAQRLLAYLLDTKLPLPGAQPSTRPPGQDPPAAAAVTDPRSPVVSATNRPVAEEHRHD